MYYISKKKKEVEILVNTKQRQVTMDNGVSANRDVNGVLSRIICRSTNFLVNRFSIKNGYVNKNAWALKHVFILKYTHKF